MTGPTPHPCWRGATGLLLVLLVLLGVAGAEQCLEVTNLGSCAPWAIGKYHKQDDSRNDHPVWHKAGEHEHAGTKHPVSRRHPARRCLRRARVSLR